MQKVEWAQALLRTLGAPETKHNVAFLCAWSDMEGTKAAWNPLATTTAHAGATNFNHIGVKNYDSFQSGLEATAHAIRNGHYPNILQGLMTSNTQLAFSHSQDWLTWAGNANYSDKLSARMDQYLHDPSGMSAELRASAGPASFHAVPFDQLPDHPGGFAGVPDPLHPVGGVVDPVHDYSHSPDSDHDGLADAFEVDHHLDPHSVDSNHDGLSDAWAVMHFGAAGALSSDIDHDGISNAVEIAMGSDPTHADPNAGGHLPVSGVDADHDHLDDLIESILHTSVHSGDSDGDGISDFVEHAYGTDPTHAAASDSQHMMAADDPFAHSGDHLFGGDHLSTADHSFAADHSLAADHTFGADHAFDAHDFTTADDIIDDG